MSVVLASNTGLLLDVIYDCMCYGTVGVLVPFV